MHKTIIILAFLLASCARQIEAEHYTYEGHDYIIMRQGHHIAVTHDPDCPCHDGEDIYSDQLDEWQTLQMSIAMTESEYHPDAVSGNCYGLLQITPIFAAEANRIVGREVYSHQDAFDPAKALEMFHIVQQAKNPGRDIDKAIMVHNPEGKSIGYDRKVKANMEYIKRMESIRQIVTAGMR